MEWKCSRFWDKNPMWRREPQLSFVFILSCRYLCPGVYKAMKKTPWHWNSSTSSCTHTSTMFSASIGSSAAETEGSESVRECDIWTEGMGCFEAKVVDFDISIWFYHGLDLASSDSARYQYQCWDSGMSCIFASAFHASNGSILSSTEILHVLKHCVYWKPCRWWLRRQKPR